ncbi:MAG: hypothetical protein RL213_1122 [Bacteroidota bacterium]
MILGLTVSAVQPTQSRVPQNTKMGRVPARLQTVTRPFVKKGPLMDDGIPVANPVNRTFTQPARSQNGTYLRVAGVEEAIIGGTVYDLQTNATISNRLVKNVDGTITAAWTYAANTSFADRGTGYNYYDPSNPNLWTNGWVDPISGNGPGVSTITRTEGTYRTGFTNIVNTSTGKEMSIAHSSTATGILLNWRATKGTGTWAQSVIGTAPNNDTWAKATSDGDTVHAIWQGSGTTATPIDGQDGPIYYSRSNDGGATWNPLKTIIPLIDSNYYGGFGGDSYSIDARNGVVAIAYSGAFKDVGLLKSSDGGNTWTKTIVQTGFMNFFNDANLTPDVDGDGDADSVQSNAEDAHVLIDNNGQCHVWFGSMFYMNDDSTDDSYSYYPYTDGLLYWNESMATDSAVFITGVIDANNDGFINIPEASSCASPSLLVGNYGGGGLTQMPSAGIDANGVIYLSYQSLCEACDTNTFTVGATQGRRHVYLMTSSDGGMTWTDPVDIVPTVAEGGNGEFQEAVYADLARIVDSHVYVLYQRDTQPGTSLATAGTCDQINNAGAGASDIVFAKVPVGVANGITSPSRKPSFNVSQNYPNPTNGLTSFDVTLEKASGFVVRVMDVVGKTVYTETFSNMTAGAHTVTLNTNGYSAGVYTYSVTADDYTVTNRMVVR